MKALSLAGDGLCLNCLDFGGEGSAPLLFLHGGSAHAHWWDFVAPALADRFHPLALDQRGHGDSEWAADWAYGSRHYVADLRKIIDGWKFGAPVIVGHSMGGHNAMHYAAEPGARIRALVVVESTPDYPQRAVDFLRLLSARPARRFDSLAQAIAKFSLLPRETLAAPEVLRHVASYTFRQDSGGKWIHKLDRRTMIREPLEVFDLLPRITCPALVIKAEKSPLPTIERAREMAGAMRNGRLAVIGDAYHHVMLDNPDGFISTLDSFLKTLE